MLKKSIPLLRLLILGRFGQKVLLFTFLLLLLVFLLQLLNDFKVFGISLTQGSIFALMKKDDSESDKAQEP